MKINYSIKPIQERRNAVYLVDTAIDPGDHKLWSIRLNTNQFQSGDILTYDKYLGCELYITHNPIMVGDSWEYTVKTITSASIYRIPDDKLVAGTQIYQIGTAF